jgi:hypothetical protein
MDQNSFESTRKIDASAMQVLFAFVNEAAVRTWWKAKNVVLQPRPGGLLVVEWDPAAAESDDVLGSMGGVLAGVLDRSMAGHFVYFGALHWLTPGGETYGPTRLEFDVFSRGDPRSRPTLLRVRGSGFQEGPAWQRYRERSLRKWEDELLPAVAAYCEAQPAGQAESEVLGLGGSYFTEAVLKHRRIS